MESHQHDRQLFLALSIVGVMTLGIMAILNMVIGEYRLGLLELGAVGVGVINFWLFWWLKKESLAKHIVLLTVGSLLLLIVMNGGIGNAGYLWVAIYPPLAFALTSIKMASWYVSILGICLAGLGMLEYFGYQVSTHSAYDFLQLCLSYAVVSLMVSLAERSHKRMSSKLRIFQTAVAQSSEMMVITDPQGIVLWGNEATKSVTGFSVEESLGKKAGVLWGKLMSQAYYKNMWRVIKEQKEVYISEIRNHRKNGEQFYSTISIYPLLDSRGEIEYFVGTQRDITHEREVDQMKSDFVGLVSHQLRSPLSSMRWNLEMLLQGDIGKLTSKQSEVISQVTQANARMIKLVTTLLNISRLESGKLIVESEHIDLAKFLQTTIDELGERFQQRQQRVKLVTQTKSQVVSIDPQLLRQVMQNLLNNARKYSPEGSKITVVVDQESGEWKISVVDKGSGIPRDEQHKVFGKYFRASNAIKQQSDGTGMGLYLNQLIVKVWNGKLGFESKVGQGSSFWFTLPIEGIKPQSGKVRLT